MNESYLIYYLILNIIILIVLTLWIYNTHRFLVDIVDDQRLIVEGMKYLERRIDELQENLESLCLDGDLYIKDGDNVKIDTTESVIYHDKTGKIIGDINKT